MTDNVTTNPGSGGDVIAADDIGGVKYQRVKATFGPDGSATDVSDSARLPVAPHNVTPHFREVWEDGFSPTGPNWTQTVSASGDIVQLEGNSFGEKWLAISKDPLSPGTDTILECNTTFKVPFELSIGLHASQRTSGQELALEVVDTDATLAPIADLAIASISQTGTTLTVVTVDPHGLSAGMRIAIYGCPYSPYNYSWIVVADIPDSTSFRSNAGSTGSLPSLTAGTYNAGYVCVRPALGYANDGTSCILENPTLSNASFYVRDGVGDVTPSGTANGNQSTAINNSASTSMAVSQNVYAFAPVSEMRLSLFQEKMIWSDVSSDSLSSQLPRFLRTNCVPSPNRTYKLRLRATNSKAMTQFVARVVSSTKSGTTTATVVTDAPHGLTTLDFVLIYGNRDYTNFATGSGNLVASVIDDHTFTVIYGGVYTGTTFGGVVVRQQGNTTGAVIGLNTTSQTQTVARLNNVLTVVGNASWTNLSIGDLVNVHGMRDNIGDLGVDGVYRVRNLSTVTLTLEPVNAPSGATITTTSCGGSIIRRTDLRLSYLRVFNTLRQRVEIMPRGDASSAASVNVTSINASLAASSQVIGDVAQQYRANNTGAASGYHLVSAATNNAALILTGTRRLLGWYFANTSAVWQYVKFYNKATAPVPGTDTPVKTIGIPPGGSTEFHLEGGQGFSLGLGIAVTTGFADLDNTVTTVGAVVGDVAYA